MEVSDAVIKQGVYRHFKGGLYEVLQLAKHSETKEDYVVYRALYGTRDIWVRPRTMFAELVEHDGATLPRFTWVENANTPAPPHNRRRRVRST